MEKNRLLFKSSRVRGPSAGTPKARTALPGMAVVGMAVVGVAMLGLLWAAPSAARQSVAQPESKSEPVTADPTATATVRVVIDYNNGVEKHYTRIPYRKNMTVLDALKHAESLNPGISFEYTGRHRTALLKSIDGFANQGGGQTARNWIYRVNGQLAERSFGILKLKPGDTILWKFDVYTPK